MQLLRGEGEGRSDGPPPEAVEDEASQAPDLGRRLVCAACRAPVTSRAHRVEVHGAHAHRRVNPSGVDFHLGCFAEAPGAFAEGAPTLHWTWFPGYAWQVAGCRACRQHLGWRFSGEEGAFFGLIVSRLLDEDAPS